MSSPSPPNPTNLTGSCHCHFITYTLNLPDSQLSNPTGTRCNCRICTKTGFTSLHLANPSQEFKLITPVAKSDLSEYEGTSANSTKSRLYFCKKCGVHVFVEGIWEKGDGTRVEFFHVNWATVDQPLPSSLLERGNGKGQGDRVEGDEDEGPWIVDLSKVKIGYYDGLTNNWAAGMKDAPYRGGLP